jgi:hypothetical protein
MKWIQRCKKRWLLLIDRACAGIIITKFTFLVKCWKFAVFLNRRKKKHWRIQLCCLKIFIHREYVRRPAWISGVLVIQSAVSGQHWFDSFTYLIVACMWTGPHYSCPISGVVVTCPERDAGAYMWMRFCLGQIVGTDTLYLRYNCRESYGHVR